MKTENLEIVNNAITNVLSDLKIEPEDKLELLINIHEFLNPKEYEENVKVLRCK